METSEHKTGKIFLGFAVVCLVVVPLLALSALSGDPEEAPAPLIEEHAGGFDWNGQAVFDREDRMTRDYLAGLSTGRNLEEYYSRRQYLGSPPVIPHKLEAEDGSQWACLSCHADGGWTEELKRNTPITPHPEQTACWQCHVRPDDNQALFVENNWISTQRPRLGRAYLPGSPPPVPHSLQMRADCIACHVGPGAVAEIRVEHPARGNCRQCHVPDLNPGLFVRPTNR